MNFSVVKKKDSSLRELSREKVEFEEIDTLQDLLKKMCIYKYTKQSNSEKTLLSKNEIQQSAYCGKIDFDVKYNEKKYDIDKAQDVMIQDFKDGLFRVYINGNESTDL